MYTNTAYEALYTYIGLGLHEKFIDVLTSQAIFGAIVMIVFGYMFFTTTVSFFSRYIPGPFMERKSAPLSRIVKTILFLFLGLGLLRVGTSMSISSHAGKSWAQNRYIQKHIPQAKGNYKVSIVFDFLSTVASEIAGFVDATIDDLFESSNSQLEAPNLIYKAAALSASASIKSPELKESLGLYVSDCLEHVLPLATVQKNAGIWDQMFSDHAAPIDRTLSEISLSNPNEPANYTCLDLKNEIVTGLYDEAESASNRRWRDHASLHGLKDNMKSFTARTKLAADILTNQLMAQSESVAGIQKGSQLPTSSTKFVRYISRLFSWSSISTLWPLGSKNFEPNRGFVLAAKRGEEFSEHLARAPHVAGFVKMLLIAIFPWLIFPIVAGYWRVLLYWWAIFFSVLLWSPLWTLLYHIMTGIALSTETLSHLGKVSDGISLVSANAINYRLNYMFVIYSWLQMIIGPGFTLALLVWLKPFQRDTEAEVAPEAISSATTTAAVGSKIVTGV